MFNMMRIINDKRQVLVLPNLYFQIYLVLGNSTLSNIYNWQKHLRKFEDATFFGNGNLEGYYNCTYVPK